ncbi:MAG: GTPase HflX [Phycisphaerae bacterium]|nr:GTPase HflX [Phycisphaerae bacterium]
MAELVREDLSVQRERALLVKVVLPGVDFDARNPLGELASLAEAAGAQVVDGMTQKRMRPSARTYAGRGKVQEIRQRADANEATVVIFDNELAPSQIRALEEVIERKILDRSELILDIFAARAQTLEARLQVELAQLQYTAPRLRGMWSHLERIAGVGGATGAGAVGGIGTRGPGERQIEVDRRIVGRRITHLKSKLDEIDRRKLREVQARRDEFTVSLVGYTNSGKSTLINALTDAGQHVEDKLFATLDTKTIRWNLGEGQSVLLSDTIGFVRDLPHRLVASFQATLEATIHADLRLHVVDVSSRDAPRQVDAVDRVLGELDCTDAPTLALLNKCDIAEDQSIIQVLETRLPATLRISATTGMGLDCLVERVREWLNRRIIEVTVRIPVHEGKLIAQIDQKAAIAERRYESNYVEMRIRINPTHLKQLVGRYPALSVIAPPSDE